MKWFQWCSLSISEHYCASSATYCSYAAGIEPAELGTRQQCRDNVTMFSGQKVFGYCLLAYCIIPVFVVTTPSRNRPPKHLSNIFWSLRSSITLWHCRCCKAKNKIARAQVCEPVSPCWVSPGWRGGEPCARPLHGEPSQQCSIDRLTHLVNTRPPKTFKLIVTVS